MGTTAEKGARVLQSIAEVQEGINNLGGSLTDQTPFKDFKTELDNIYDTLPKTSFQEGTEVTIENGLKGKIDFDDGKVGFGQASQESTNGYQLLSLTNGSYSVNGITAKVQDGEITLNGTSTAQASIYIPIVDIPLVTTDKFSFAFNRDGEFPSGVGMYFTDSSKALIRWDFGQAGLRDATNFSPQADATAHYFHIAVNTTGTSFSNFKLKPMFEKGATSHTWEPYTGGYASPSPNWEQEVKCVRGNQSIVESGKNKLPCAEQSSNEVNNMTFISNGKGTYTLNGTASATSYYDYSIDNYVIQDTDYLYLKNTETNSNISVALLNGSTQIMYTGPSSVNRIVSLSSYAGSTIDTLRIRTTAQSLTNFTIKPMISDTASLTEFIEYHKNTYPISLGSLELCGIGNYKDELIYDVDEDKVYKYEKIKEVNLAQLVYEYQNESTSPTPRTVVKTYGIGTFVGDWLSNIFVQNSTSSNRIVQLSGESITYVSIANDIAGISGSETESQKVQKIVSVLSEKNAVLITPKATPTLTEITDTTLHQQVNNWYYSQSFNGTTIIESNGDLPMIIKVRALKGE